MFLFFQFSRFSYALQIQLPLLGFCCKMSSTFKLHNVIIASLYALSLSLKSGVLHFSVLCSWIYGTALYFLVIKISFLYLGFHVLPFSTCLHIFHCCNDCRKWGNLWGFTVAVLLVRFGLLHVRTLVFNLLFGYWTPWRHLRYIITDHTLHFCSAESARVCR